MTYERSSDWPDAETKIKNMSKSVTLSLIFIVVLSTDLKLIRPYYKLMSKFMTPEDLLNSQVQEFNKGNIDFLMTLYEKDACFVSKPGQVVNDKESIRRAFQGFIDMGGEL